MIRVCIGPDSKYQFTPDAKLLWRLWGEEYVVYNSASGDTHLLDLLTGQILKQLESSPRGPLELADLICSEFEFEPNAPLIESIEDRLKKLSVLKLIELAP